MSFTKTLRLIQRLGHIFVRDLKHEIIYTLNDLFLWHYCESMSGYYQVKKRQVQIIKNQRGYEIIHYIQGDYSYKSRVAYCRFNQLLAPFVNRSHYY